MDKGGCLVIADGRMMIAWWSLKDASWSQAEGNPGKVCSGVSCTSWGMDCRDGEADGGVRAKGKIQVREGSSQKAAIQCLEDTLRKFFHQCWRSRYPGFFLLKYSFFRYVEAFCEHKEQALE